MAVTEAWSRLTDPDGLPDRSDLPWYVAPLPAWLENLGLRLAWVIVGVNVLGTAFGIYYYLPQLSRTATVMWPVVPDSPTATLFVAASLAAWKLGYADRIQPLHALAFFGCLKLGVWTPFVLLVFSEGFAYHHPAMYHFLFWSHLGMVAEAFLIYRYADFSPRAVFVALAWYGGNDVVDYFHGVVGGPHHTLLPAQVGTPSAHAYPDHLYAAAGAVVLTLLATYLALSTRVKQLERDGESGDRP